MAPIITGLDTTGVNDCAAAINTYFQNNLYGSLLPGTYRLSETIVVPTGGHLWGEYPNSPGNPTSGVNLVADQAVNPALQLGGTAYQEGTGSLRRVNVLRSGTPALTSVGIKVVDGFNVIMEDVASVNHGQCFYVFAQPALGMGLGFTANRIFSQTAYDAHIVIDSWPEARFTNCRFGMSGSGDVNCNAYVRITGGVANTEGGPNTISFVNTQFNQGQNKAVHGFEFVGLPAPGSISLPVSEYTLSASHMEAVSGAYFYSDATWDKIIYVNIGETTFADSTPDFIGLNAATQMTLWTLNGVNISAKSFSNALPVKNGGFGAFHMNGGWISAPTINLIGSNGMATFNGVTFQGNVVATGNWGALTFSGGGFFSGALNTTKATGSITVVK